MKTVFSSLIVFILLSCSGNSEIQEQAELQLNILWLVAEDQSPYFFPMYGDSTVALPALQSLADNARVFTRAYTPSPVCSPARSALITGMYPTTLGTHNMRNYDPYAPKDSDIAKRNISPPAPDGVRCFTEYLRLNGYFCFNNPKEDYNFSPPLSAWDESSHEADWSHRDPGQPFFGVINFNSTHESMIWRNHGDSLLIDPSGVAMPVLFPDDTVIRVDLAVNYSNLIRMDRKVNTVLRRLKEEGLWENTIIFFFADHGGPFPRFKRSIYETGLRVPLVIRIPGEQGEAKTEKVSFIDFAPTVLSLAGIQPPGWMQGRAFLGDYREPEPDCIFAATDRFDQKTDRRRAVICNQWKYIRNFNPDIPFALDIDYRKNMPIMKRLLERKESGTLNKQMLDWFSEKKPVEELYDLENDPYELINLAESPEYAETREKMRKKLDVWIRESGDLGRIPEDSLRKIWISRQLAKPEIKGDYLISNDPYATIIWRSRGGKWNVYDKNDDLSYNKYSIEAKAVRIGYQDSEILKINPYQ